MKKYMICCFVAASALVACNNDEAPGESAGVRSGGANADLIRNPVSANQPLDTSKLARISFEAKEYDFGRVNEGDIVTHEFKFTNTGNMPLTILNAHSSCGCTVSEYPKDPIPPGGSGVISARFNTDGRHDLEKKLIYVTSNTYPSETSLLLKGYVDAVNK